MRWVLLLTLLSLQAQAGQINLTCTLPTENEDGSALTDLEGINFYEGPSGGPYVLIATETACGTIFDRPTGTYFYVGTAFNTQGVESRYTNEVSVVISDIPEPPTNLVVGPGNLVAYALSQTADIIVAYPVGTAPQGTQCNPAMRFNDKYVIPRAEVTWAGTVRPQVVFAECGAG